MVCYLHEGQCPEYQEDRTVAMTGRDGQLTVPGAEGIEEVKGLVI